MACANCGQQLVHLRVDIQQAGQREVVLTWLVCPSCRHVALRDWSWHQSPDQEKSSGGTDHEDETAGDVGNAAWTR